MDIYNKTAQYYDFINSRQKDYKTESEKIRSIIKKHNEKAKTILDVACGTGTHLLHLKRDFKVIGLDVDQDMLKIAKRKNPGIRFIRADMASFSINQKFDVIISLFSGIGYLKTYVKLEKTIKNFHNHLNAKGILIIEPWFTKKTFTPGKPWVVCAETLDVKVSRANVSKVKGSISILDFHYLIAKKNKDVEYLRSIHELGLFDTSRFLKILKENGFKAKFVRNGLMENRGLFIAVKQ